jgi:hypothetical protein
MLAALLAWENAAIVAALLLGAVPVVGLLINAVGVLVSVGNEREASRS